MARVEPLSPPYSAEVQARFDAAMPPGVPPLWLFRIMAKGPRRWNKLVGGSLLDPGPLTIRQREIVINRTCAVLGCEYEWGVHVAFFADAANLTVDEIKTITLSDPRAPCWSLAEQALIVAADSLFLNNKLSSLEFDELNEHYDEN